MDKDKKKMLAGAGVLGGAAAIIYFLTRKPLVPPPPPDRATLYGKATDAQTGKAIQSIEVSLDEYSGVTQPDGYYLIENIIPGGYAVTFCDPLGRYEPLTL